MKILVLDDEPSIRRSVQAMLEEASHEVECVDNASDAATMVKQGDYDFVIFDYLMPDRDGRWFIKHVKLGKTKAILMTAYGTPDLLNDIIKRGASGYLLKPFTAADLFRQLEIHSSESQA